MRAIWFAAFLCVACGPSGRPDDMLGSGSQVDAGCATSCSDDLRSVIDCNGNVVQSCAASDQCDTSAIQCTNACAAAEANHRSVGCDYYATYMDSEIPQYCFAVFVANTWTTPAHVSVEYNGQSM